jgi:hypothetical protein
MCHALTIVRAEQLADLKYVNVALRLLKNRDRSLNVDGRREIRGRLNEILTQYNITEDMKYGNMRDSIVKGNYREMT